ncbi:hypothetical protein ACVGV8_14815, partial [Enterobacter intestinihominis]
PPPGFFYYAATSFIYRVYLWWAAYFFYKRQLYFVVFIFFFYYNTTILVFIMRLMGVGVDLGARVLVLERGGAGVGFSSITTIGIMFGQNMHPDSDLVFS